MEKVYLTKSGAQALHNELNDLIRVQRPKVIDMVAEARAHGDLKENAEYQAAKEKQSFVEGRINEVQVKLSMAEIIDPTQTKNKNKVSFGAKVVIVDMNDNQQTYTIVGEEESDTKQKKIAYSSPLARAILGKQVGDEIVLNTPSGETCYELLKICYD